MRQFLARVPASIVIAASVLWVLGIGALPLFYARLQGWGLYWAFSPGEFLASILLLLGPPLVLVIVWRRVRRRDHGEGAV